MDSELALLSQKIDQLTTQVEAQRQRLELLKVTGDGNALVLEKLEYLIQQMDAQRRRQEEFDEFKRDVTPIVNQMVKLSIEELAEIGTEFQAEDLFFLLKRLLRDTNLLVSLLDRMEATVELVDETQRVGKQVFQQTVATLDRLEREGYFNFARGGWNIVERIVNEFSEEDVQALADNVVTILTTVKNLTQPEIMSMTNNVLYAIQQQPAPTGEVSIWALLRDFNDPKVRKGLARLLNLVKVLADQPASQDNPVKA
jgi:uncharacterized protein YjgD (DUF1641 family)